MGSVDRPVAEGWRWRHVTFWCADCELLMALGKEILDEWIKQMRALVISTILV